MRRKQGHTASRNKITVGFNVVCVVDILGQADYLQMRADGRIDLHIRASIKTDDGSRSALSVDGVGSPRATEPIADLYENVRLNTARHPCCAE
jgi:hypothetical protein